MKYAVSHNKIFKSLELILFIGFTILAGFFASGVLEQFSSHRTSFSQYEKEITDYPVISIDFDRPALEVNLTNVIFIYYTYGTEKDQILEIGENYFHNEEYNLTQKVILESLETSNGNKAFRIIHTTPILIHGGDRASVKIFMYTKLEKKIDSDVSFYLTSLDNSPGFYDFLWEDGKEFQLTTRKNAVVKCNIETQVTHYLEKNHKCQKEAIHATQM